MVPWMNQYVREASWGMAPRKQARENGMRFKYNGPMDEPTCKGGIMENSTKKIGKIEWDEVQVQWSHR